jgi:hypothetical protein
MPTAAGWGVGQRREAAHARGLRQRPRRRRCAVGVQETLKDTEKALKRSNKALDREKSKRDEIVSNMASLSGSISGKFDVNLGARPANVWAPGTGGALSAIMHATSQAQAFPGIVAALKAAGLTGSALSEVLQEMDFGQLQALAADPSQAGQIGSALGGLYSAQQVAGGSGAQAVYGEALAGRTKRSGADPGTPRHPERGARVAA